MMHLFGLLPPGAVPELEKGDRLFLFWIAKDISEHRGSEVVGMANLPRTAACTLVMLNPTSQS
jgi:hypothetical protein